MKATRAALEPALSPRGQLLLRLDPSAPESDEALAARLQDAFARGVGEGLLSLAGPELKATLSPTWGWWRAFSTRYLTAVCARPPSSSAWATLPPPPEAQLRHMLAGLPPMRGAEYLDPATLSALWDQLNEAFTARLSRARDDAQAVGDAQPVATLQAALRALNPSWNVLGRVHLNLAENRRDPDAPFAFMATYADGLSESGRARHRPLAQALRRYASDKAQLLALLEPIQRAGERCDWLRLLTESGELFHPLRWRPGEALRLLEDTPELEQAGVVVRLPASWGAKRPARPRVVVTVGGEPPSTLGLQALLDFQAQLCLDGAPLSPAEIDALLGETRGLVFLRGQWVEVDPERLQRALAQIEGSEALAQERGLSFSEATRLLAGAPLGADAAVETDREWATVEAGPWLSRTLRELRAPEDEGDDPVPGLQGTLRPYQRRGLRWLRLLTSLGLGACLADDMGLGKTIQVLSLLLSRKQAGGAHQPSLLVAPTSLMTNWVAELERFTPQLTHLTLHRSAGPPSNLRELDEDDLSGVDLVITTYGSLRRLPWLRERRWDLVVLDEAQAIKNPGAQQTQAAKRLQAHARIALTGTPVENRLGDLWSLFDFINPGLLGGRRQFSAYVKQLSGQQDEPFAPLRSLVAPYILRRLKTDPGVAPELPEKTELVAWCGLSPKQAALYQQAVDDLERQLSGREGVARRGAVLAALTRFKQLCNHPSQWLGDDEWDPADSGKFTRLAELAEEIAARQEKLLVFTQFRQLIPPLSAHLSRVFGQPGLSLDGGTSVRERARRVQRFQEDDATPFFLLSLKAGGTGLNLTAASHVVHFDRWWNPAVEDQATDRAYRIGQQRGVLVHKLTCRGTVEERVDALIQSKRRLSEQLIEGGVEPALTELDDAALLRLVALDLNAAMQE